MFILDIFAVDAKPGEVPNTKPKPKDKFRESAECDAVRKEYADVMKDKPPGHLPHKREGVYASEHDINLKPNAEIPRFSGYGGSVASAEIMTQMVKTYAEQGYVIPSESKFASPAILVKKPGGGFRLIIDYRMLNDATLKKSGVPPNIRDILNRLHGATTFSIMDLYQGYYLMPMSKESQSKTAFVYKDELGHTQKYEWTVMPLGLQGAPSSFQDL